MLVSSLPLEIFSDVLCVILNVRDIATLVLFLRLHFYSGCLEPGWTNTSPLTYLAAPEGWLEYATQMLDER